MNPVVVGYTELRNAICTGCFTYVAVNVNDAIIRSYSPFPKNAEILKLLWRTRWLVYVNNC